MGASCVPEGVKKVPKKASLVRARFFQKSIRSDSGPHGTPQKVKKCYIPKNTSKCGPKAPQMRPKRLPKGPQTVPNRQKHVRNLAVVSLLKPGHILAVCFIFGKIISDVTEIWA